jgi:transposase
LTEIHYQGRSSGSDAHLETMERKKVRPRRSFNPELKADLVERGRAGDRTIGQVARDFDLTSTATRV